MCVRAAVSASLMLLLGVGCVRVQTVVSSRYKIPKGSSVTVQMKNGDVYGVGQAVESALEDAGLDVISEATSGNIDQVVGENKILTTGEIKIERTSTTVHKSKYLCQVNIGFYYYNHPHVDNTTVKIIDLMTGKVMLSMSASGGTVSAAGIKAELKQKLPLVIAD